MGSFKRTQENLVEMSFARFGDDDNEKDDDEQPPIK